MRGWGWRGGGGERGKHDYCGATGRPQVTFKIIRGAPAVYPLFLHLCRLHLVFAGRIGYCVGFAMLWLIYI